MRFLVFDGAGGDAVADGEAHFYRSAGNGYSAGISRDGLIGDALRRLRASG